MKRSVTDYATLIFDCDGVVLDSNRIKTDAFYQTTLSFGEVAAQAMVEYHVANGGVSRYQKFEYFLRRIVKAHDIDNKLANLLTDFSRRVSDALMKCAIDESLADLRVATEHSKWLIVSGGDQNELRDVFKRRALAAFFDGGIFGSPDTKESILAREIESGNIALPALFLGDSRYDYEVATGAELDFVFVSRWTEVNSWSDFTEAVGALSIERMGDLL